MDLKDEANIIEAVLFLENDPLDIKSISRITRLSKDVVEESISLLINEYKKDHHGIELTEIGGCFSFTPKKELWPYLKERYGKRNENKLSRAALETLSIIAYSQPITRSEIENIRGVSADSMIRLLLNKSMIKEVGKKDIIGKPVQYGTTTEFLKLFCLKSIADLPKLDEIDNEKFKSDD